MRKLSTLELLTRIIVAEFHTRKQLGLFDYEIQPKQEESLDKSRKALYESKRKIHARNGVEGVRKKFSICRIINKGAGPSLLWCD